jgi:hypothetical protein
MSDTGNSKIGWGRRDGKHRRQRIRRSHKDSTGPVEAGQEAVVDPLKPIKPRTAGPSSSARSAEPEARRSMSAELVRDDGGRDRAEPQALNRY